MTTTGEPSNRTLLDAIFLSILCTTSRCKGIVLDFCKAIDDVKSKTLRLLGDPVQRFEEDPVRMLRTLRLQLSSTLKLIRQFSTFLMLR